MAESILADSRWSMTKTKVIPEEIDVRGELPRIGVFVCKCGTNIAGVLDVPAIAQYARGLPNVVFVDENLFSCSQDTQEKMTQVIKEQKLNRVVVAACSPLTHEVLFQETVVNAGINKSAINVLGCTAGMQRPGQRRPKILCAWPWAKSLSSNLCPNLASRSTRQPWSSVAAFPG
jgi:hypothetical protein